jgi:ABC-type oligopeptide transport system substrate-binding subunit
LFSGGWCADYPDPENFADVLFHSGSDMNNGGYSNSQLDALLEQARVERDVTKRMEMYHQAEQIIVDDAPVLFTTHSLSYELVKPYLKGYVFTPISIPLERYMWLEGK